MPQTWYTSDTHFSHNNILKHENRPDTYKVGKVIPTVNFDWKNGTTVGNYNMSARWTGYVKPKYSEEYTLSVNSSDGIRLYVDNKLVIDNWYAQSRKEIGGLIMLEAGNYYSIKLEYFNSGDTQALVQLYWFSPSQSKEIIPQSQLFSK